MDTPDSRPFTRIDPPRTPSPGSRGLNWTLPVFCLVAIAYVFVNPRLPASNAAVADPPRAIAPAAPDRPAEPSRAPSAQARR